MSEPEKCFSRPKVRFSKSAEFSESTRIDRALGKPKIRSVKILQPRVKILKAPLANDESEQNLSPDEIISRRSAGDAPNDSRLCPAKSSCVSAPCLTEILLSPESHRDDRGLLRAKRKPYQTLASHDRAAQKTSKTAVVNEKSLSAKNIQSCTEKISKKSFSSLPDKVTKSSDKESVVRGSFPGAKTTIAGKENIPSGASGKGVIFKVPRNGAKAKSETAFGSTVSRNDRTKIGQKSSDSVVTKPIESAIESRVEAKMSVKSKPELEVTKKLAQATMRGKKSVESKSATIGSTTCMKYDRAKSKNDPAKKTILRNLSVAPSGVYIGPGSLRSKSPELGIIRSGNEKNWRSRSEIHSSEKLARPEYNSIVRTIKKLRDAREDKIIEDLEHLPAIYRRLVNGKVSSALDFGANEAIYRDLVDLSIDEKQLPARLTRSKDPEPRQRDIEPKLSDFFVPTNDEEFRRAVLVRPPSPRVLDTWNPYKISDRIFFWKESLDHDL